MKIKWLRQALRNLEQVQEYLADYNLEASRETIKKIQSAVSQLADYPLMGREGRVAGTRELVISQTPYIIIYRVKRDAVEILRVLHTAKRYPEVQ